MSDNTNLKRAIFSNAIATNSDLIANLSLNKETVFTANDPNMIGLIADNSGEEFLSLVKCKKSNKKRPCTRGGNGTTTNTASGNCTCRKVCTNKNFDDDFDDDFGGIVLSPFNQIDTIDFEDDSMDF